MQVLNRQYDPTCCVTTYLRSGQENTPVAPGESLYEDLVMTPEVAAEFGEQAIRDYQDKRLKDLVRLFHQPGVDQSDIAQILGAEWNLASRSMQNASDGEVIFLHQPVGKSRPCDPSQVLWFSQARNTPSILLRTEGSSVLDKTDKIGSYTHCDRQELSLRPGHSRLENQRVDSEWYWAEHD